MASTKGIHGTVIKKLKFKKIMKRILGIITFIIGLKIFDINNSIIYRFANQLTGFFTL